MLFCCVAAFEALLLSDSLACELESNDTAKQVWCLALGGGGAVFNCLQKCATTPPALYLICRLVYAASTESPWTLIGEGLAGPLVVALRV